MLFFPLAVFQLLCGRSTDGPPLFFGLGLLVDERRSVVTATSQASQPHGRDADDDDVVESSHR